jgi:pimeloyl-ACP methyl ester carboxylesterase
MKRSVLLIHGAWHGAWCWEPVLQRLEDSGIDIAAIDLPGHGEDAHAVGDLASDAARVCKELDKFEDGVILVGHSYGGAVITQAGAHPVVVHLVFLAAFPLEEGETCASAAANEPDAIRISHKGRPNLGSGFIEGPVGMISLDPPVAAQCLYNDCDEDTTAWALARLGPQALVTLQQSPTEISWRDKASTYAVCTNDMAVHPDLQRVLARRCRSVVEWPSDHSPFLCRPDLVARLLLELVGGPD